MTTPPPRHVTIDALRGFAVMGILLMNIAGFALPSGAYFNPLAGGGTTPVDLALWAVNFVLSTARCARCSRSCSAPRR